MLSLSYRGDLLACMEQYGEGCTEKFAECIGFSVRETENTDTQAGTASETISSTSVVAPTEIVNKKPHASYLQMVSYQRLQPDEIVNDTPEWLQKATSYQDNDPELIAKPDRKPPPHQPLMPWRRLWPFLKLALGDQTHGHRPDLPRTVESLAKGKILRRLPRIRRNTWAGRVQLLIDYDQTLVPFWTDFNQLRTRLANFRGLCGLEIIAFPDGILNGQCWRLSSGGWDLAGEYQLPEPGTPVLVLSDLGCNEQHEQRRLRWRRLGKRLAHASCRSVALMPCPSRGWDGELSRWFVPVCWDQSVRPPRHLARKHGTCTNRDNQKDSKTAKRLLTVLASAIRIEPALLRAVRCLFPASDMDVGTEYAAWNHTDVHPTLLAFYFEKSKVPYYRERMKSGRDLDPSLRKQVAALIQSHHAHLSPVIAHEEQLVYTELFGEPCTDEIQHFAERTAKTLYASQVMDKKLFKQWLQRLGSRQHPSFWQCEAMSAAWLLAHSEKDLTKVALPDGLSINKLAWVVGIRTPVKRQIRQRGEALVLVDTTQNQSGSRIVDLELATDFVQVETKIPESRTDSQLYRSDQVIPISQERPLLIRSSLDECYFNWLTVPVWARSLGRDRFGLYADLEFKGVIQRFRWINPGEFLMGSPPVETERYDNELQHPVTLSQGFWLADSACTQALWTAVMEGNPSKFQDDPKLPVERVSWKDVQEFIFRLNELVPGLDARLPFEAEWEYACRAGTQTPFSFGDTITPEQVNYADGKQGPNRQKTVPVKSLPPNPWGLYEMHGNVWEWCQDWYGHCSGQVETDPVGPPKGSYRVLRGGSCFHLAWDVRSAYRSRSVPALRDFYGFRLALGRTGESGTEQMNRPAEAGRTAASERGGQAGLGRTGSKR